jgi:predicted component of type VI protein secretion system
MKTLLAIFALCLLVGCSSGDADTVKVPDSATQGGNVVKDEASRKLMGADSTNGGDAAQGGLSTSPQ